LHDACEQGHGDDEIGVSNLIAVRSVVLLRSLYWQLTPLG
jgi:hypothetical protein